MAAWAFVGAEMEWTLEVAGDGASAIVVIKSFLRFGHILLLV